MKKKIQHLKINTSETELRRDSYSSNLNTINVNPMSSIPHNKQTFMPDINLNNNRVAHGTSTPKEPMVKNNRNFTLSSIISNDMSNGVKNSEPHSGKVSKTNGSRSLSRGKNYNQSK